MTTTDSRFDGLWKRTLALLAEQPSKHLQDLSISISLKIQCLDTLNDDLETLSCIKLLDSILEETQAYGHLAFLRIFIVVMIPKALDDVDPALDSEFICQMVEPMLSKFRLRGEVVVNSVIR